MDSTKRKLENYIKNELKRRKLNKPKNKKLTKDQETDELLENNIDVFKNINKNPPDVKTYDDTLKELIDKIEDEDDEELFDEEENYQEENDEKDLEELIDDDEENDEEELFDDDEEINCLDEETKGNDILTKELNNIKKVIATSEPNAKDLLTLPMREEDRAKLSFYYENYKSHIPYSAEWIESRETYIQLLKEYTEGFKYYQQYSKEDIQKFEKEEQKFIMFNPQLELKYKILNLNTTDSNKETILRKYNELIQMETNDDEYSKTKNWLRWATDIPHDIVNIIKIDDHTKFICQAKDLLDKELYGMQNVKEQIILYLSSKIKTPNMINTNLALLGPPGTGKTSIARLISKIIGWGFAQISFGGVEKADFLKGHEYTYVGSGPGEIVKCLKQIKYKNGVIFLDEMDKVSENTEIKSALLHIVDPSQNKEFRDMFLSEITIDLSNIWWVSSMNYIPDDSALTDRWSIITIPGYDFSAKQNIIKDYLIPKSLKNINLPENFIKLNDNAIKYLINNCSSSSDKGVRTLEKNIKDIINKLNFIHMYQDNNGNLPFKTSFDIKKKINFPLVVDDYIVSKLIKDNKIENKISFMYI